MDKTMFFLRVKVGTQILSSLGDYIVEGIPDDALERLERGSLWLGFSAEAVETLKKLPEERLNNILKIRKAQGFDDDVKIIEKALKAKTSKPKGEGKKSS